MGRQQAIGDTDAVVLCGGMGTRLRTVIGEKQKTVAYVNGRPFLFFIIEALMRQGVKRIVLSTGYQSDELKACVEEQDFAAEIIFSAEKEPLGTGGAVRLAKSIIKSDPFLVLNGDSFCRVGYADFLKFHQKVDATATLTVTTHTNRADYGSIQLGLGGQVERFLEKVSAPQAGQGHLSLVYVNAGVYCFSSDIFRYMPAGKSFSLEYDLFPQLCGKGLFALAVEGHFIDIGTPERFQEAQKILGLKSSPSEGPAGL